MGTVLVLVACGFAAASLWSLRWGSPPRGFALPPHRSRPLGLSASPGREELRALRFRRRLWGYDPAQVERALEVWRDTLPVSRDDARAGEGDRG